MDFFPFDDNLEESEIWMLRNFFQDFFFFQTDRFIGSNRNKKEGADKLLFFWGNFEKKGGKKKKKEFFKTENRSCRWLFEDGTIGFIGVRK